MRAEDRAERHGREQIMMTFITMHLEANDVDARAERHRKE
jgi:hypothetical protein